MRLPFLQDLVHTLEVGRGHRYFRIALSLAALMALTVLYDWRAFRNMASQEAMDSAQLARNLAEGKGFSTLFIRPLSIYLVRRHNLAHPPPSEPGKAPDLSQLRQNHPDLANPPLYPLVLAGLMKALPFHYEVAKKGFWAKEGEFWWYQPDVLIGLFNQVLFFALITGVFFLARHLFDAQVAWLSALLLLCTDLLWRFSVSGLSTMLLLLIFLALAGCIVLLEREAREPRWGQNGLFVLAGVAGALVGLGGLTRYSFLGLILPVVAFIVLFSGPRRGSLALLALAAFGVVMGPWIARNFWLSGAPFGTATYAVLGDTVFFPEFRLERSLNPDFSRVIALGFWLKLLTNARLIIETELPRLGGTWISAFFLVGLLVSFVNSGTRRLRYFILMCLPVLFLAQALGRTQLSETVPEVNSENLLVLLAPMVLVYGVALFFLLLDQVQVVVLPMLQLRYAVIALFSLVASLPLLLNFLPPRSRPVVYPPYLPPTIQAVSAWLKENELMMSDIPWAVAWYGRRQCVWITLLAVPDAKDRTLQEDFFTINDYQKPISMLYLTPMMMDSKFLTQWKQTEQSWGSFILQTVLLDETPPIFPLHKMPPGLLPYQIVLTDWERWRKGP